AEVAERALPVHVRGIVTFYSPPLMFVQDESKGIYVRVPVRNPAVAAGQRVDLWGVTGPGQFAPIIDLPRIKVLGPSSFPAPVRLTMDALFSGEMDGQWVELDGLVARRLE